MFSNRANPVGICLYSVGPRVGRLVKVLGELIDGAIGLDIGRIGPVKLFGVVADEVEGPAGVLGSFAGTDACEDGLTGTGSNLVELVASSLAFTSVLFFTFSPII